MHAAAEGGPNQQPERAGEVAELRGEHGTHKRAGSGDGGEVVAEDDPLGRGNEVLAIAASDSGGGAEVVDGEDLGNQPGGVKPIGDGKRADPGDDQPKGVDGFVALEGSDGDGGGSEKRNNEPEENAGKAGHGGNSAKKRKASSVELRVGFEVW